MCGSSRVGDRGGGDPLPVSPTPMAIATTVHCMRTCPRKKADPRDKARSGTNLIRVRMKTRIGFQQTPTLRFVVSENRMATVIFTQNMLSNYPKKMHSAAARPLSRKKRQDDISQEEIPP